MKARYGDGELNVSKDDFGRIRFVVRSAFGYLKGGNLATTTVCLLYTFISYVHG